MTLMPFRRPAGSGREKGALEMSMICSAPLRAARLGDVEAQLARLVDRERVAHRIGQLQLLGLGACLLGRIGRDRNQLDAGLAKRR
jgi:hypothetical protein